VHIEKLLNVICWRITNNVHDGKLEIFISVFLLKLIKVSLGRIELRTVLFSKQKN
jgi:hypothetical protein